MKKTKLYKIIKCFAEIILVTGIVIATAISITYEHSHSQILSKNISGSYNNSNNIRDSKDIIYHHSEADISHNKTESNQTEKKDSCRAEEIITKAKTLYIDKTDVLVLVNKDNKIPDDFKADLMYICNGRLQASRVIYNDLTDMLEAAGREGYSYWIASAYRSREKQQKLVDEDVNEYMKQGMGYDEALKKTCEETMPAAYSEHETGLALDILCSDNTVMNQSQKYEPGNQWLRENSYKYGFILRYPENKEGITKINYESWHFRYVGKKMTKLMYEEDITLEELQCG